MATAESPGTQALPGHGDEGGGQARIEIPTVAAVVVTRNPGSWLERALGSLRSQDYPSVAVLVVDAASDEDPSDRIAGALPEAFVRRVPHSGFAAAANEALYTIRNATFLLICHDDVVLDPGVVRLMLEEAYRSNAGIVGPKIVDADDPDVLLEVGRSIDRFGTPHTGIEPGELDQEQHDGVRDVFYVSDAAMLVRTDLFHELGGFDAARFPGAEDLDLCWRARLAGARVLVAPDARVQHHQAAGDRGDGAALDAATMARNRIRTVLTLSSARTLLWVVPVGVAASFVEALLLTITLRRGRVRSALGAWWWNLRHFRGIRRARRQARRDRRIDDRELHDLRARGARLRGFVAEHVATDDRVRSFADAGRSAVSAATERTRQPLFALAAVLALVWVIGSRHLLTGGVPAVGTFARWPGILDMLSTYASGWRYTGLGSSTAAPPGLVAMAGITTALFGADGLARTLVVVLAFPIGGFGAYRLTRGITQASAPAVVAALAYTINPVPRNAVAAGRLGPLVLFALGPFVISMAVRHGERVRGAEQRRRALTGLLGLGALLAFTTAWYPLAPLLLLSAAAAIILSAPLVGGVRLGVRVLVASVVGIVIAALLLVPWSVALLSAGGDPAALGFSFRPPLDLADVLRFHSGPAGAGWAAWGFVAAGSLALLLGRGPRFTWATRAWIMALIGWALVWLPARFAPDVSVPAPEAALSLAALGVAVAAGLGVSVFVEDVRGRGFGLRQAVAAVAAAGFALGILGFAADAGDGRWRAPDGDWPDALAFLQTERDSGGFRVLWVGDPTLLPLDPFVADDGTGYTLTRNGSGDARELWRAPSGRADGLVGDAVELASEGRTDRLGHLVAPMGVRYVAMPIRAGPGASAQAPPAGLPAALASQLDLARLEAPSGLALYENTAWIPTPGTVRLADADGVPLGSKNPTGAALRADVGGVTAVRGSPSDSAPTGPGLVMWSEAFDGDWSATVGGKTLRHVKPFGWSNGFTASERASVSIGYGDQLRRYGLIAVQVLLVLTFLVVGWRSSATRRARPPRVRRPNL
ncbi:MAG TPA: glycosyltransferase family 2 protein [Acidimicrobiia bacterium]|nr:glycosyltransferase family 2 protein [Acidimicrobiia bacterium]